MKRPGVFQFCLSGAPSLAALPKIGHNWSFWDVVNMIVSLECELPSFTAKKHTAAIPPQSSNIVCLTISYFHSPTLTQ